MMSTCTIRIITLFFIGTVFSMKAALSLNYNDCYSPLEHPLLSGFCNQPTSITQPLCIAIRTVAESERLCNNNMTTLEEKLKEIDVKFTEVKEENICENLKSMSKILLPNTNLLMINNTCNELCSSTRIILCKILLVRLDAYQHSSIMEDIKHLTSTPGQQEQSKTSKPGDTAELAKTTEPTQDKSSGSIGTVHISDENSLATSQEPSPESNGTNQQSKLATSNRPTQEPSPEPKGTSQQSKLANSNQPTQEPSPESNGDVLKHIPDDIEEKNGIHQPTNADTNSNVVQNSIKSTGQPPSSGHFMAYFLTTIVLCVAGYVVFHNKQKIIAFIVEGRSGQQRRRTDGGGEYKKLKSNVEEVMPSLDKTTASKNFIY